LGFRTESGKKITLKEVKPRQTFQWHYEYYYIYGLIEPVGGIRFFYEFSHFNSECLGLYLQQFAQEYDQEIHIIQLDNAPCHTANNLEIPDNIILLFQPPYCPELNPIERVWQYIKARLRSLLFTNLEDLKNEVAEILKSLSTEIVNSLASWEHIVHALSLSLL
jgi:transposase